MRKKIVKKIFQAAGLQVSRYDASIEMYEYLYEKYKQFTMVPKDWFTLNLELCHQYKDLEGSFVECGVWRGGMSAAIAEILSEEKKIHLFDSFEGLPKAKEIDGVAALKWQSNTEDPMYCENCKAEKKFAEEAMLLSGRSNVEIHEGWFDQTLPEFTKSPISILRLDADWYDSTIVCLDQLFPHVVKGGIIIIDDYYTWDGCSKAVHDYLSRQQSKSRVLQWYNRIAYILKND